MASYSAWKSALISLSYMAFDLLCASYRIPRTESSSPRSGGVEAMHDFSEKYTPENSYAHRLLSKYRAILQWKTDRGESTKLGFRRLLELR